MSMRILILSLVLLLGACAPEPDIDAPTRATLAIMAEVRPGMPLDDMLALLDEHLVRAMAGRLEGNALDEFRRAEAISDRLLEARIPFEWIADENYSVESRLRQIQSRSDRILAQVRTGVPRDTVLNELRILRTEVVQLRNAIAEGGTRAPTPIDVLFQSDSARRDIRPMVPQPAAPAAPAPQPLGTPVAPPGGDTTGGGLSRRPPTSPYRA
jgi:hypothetical protein